MRRFAMMAMIAGGLVAAGPVDAQSAAPSLDARMTQVEKRLNTVERVVSRQNGGAPLVQPEIGPPDASTSAAGTPARAPLADLQARGSAAPAPVAAATPAPVPTATATPRALALPPAFQPAPTPTPAAQPTPGTGPAPIP